jgi:ribonuclease HI
MQEGIDSFSMASKARTLQTQKPPIIVFTDASVGPNLSLASFAFVVINLESDFQIPQALIDKYKLRCEPESCNEECILSGIVLNCGIDAVEMVGIIAAVEVMSHLAIDTGQKIVIYTDSLISKKLLETRNLASNQIWFSKFKNMYQKLVEERKIDVSIKKVKAHSGVELNDLADASARNRLKDVNQ